MRILSIEDDERVSDFLYRGLTAEGHSMTRARDGVSGLNTAREHEFDVIILDLMLPGISGFEVCRTLRLEGNATPILMLTAMDALDNKVAGLRRGADDYLTKPFAFDELLARLEALARRGGAPLSDAAVLKLGDLTFNLDTLEAWCCGRQLELTAKEMAILELLMKSPGTVFSRERILSNIWGVSADPLTNVVEVYIGKIRKKLDCGEVGPHIETIRGRGYRMFTI